MKASKFLFWLQQILANISVRIAAFCLLSVFTALLAVILRPYVPANLTDLLSPDTIEPILTILASSMLTVSTFSLGIMATAIATAAQSSSPRATQLLLKDQTSQTVVATFLGAFVFSLIALIALRLGFYEQGGRVILWAVTVAVIVIIFLSFIRWIELLRLFGRIPDTLDRIEHATTEAIKAHLDSPLFGCNGLANGTMPPGDASPVGPREPGYVQHIDFAALQRMASENNLQIFIFRKPGAFATRNKPLAWVDGAIDDKIQSGIQDCFTMSELRSFRQDPRFGMIILAETASRALSPAVNDPGTAVDILRRAHRILARWEPTGAAEPAYANLWLEPMSLDELFEDFFRPIARDGADNIEVQIVLQKTLASLAQLPDQELAKAAKRQSDEALERSKSADLLPSEKDTLRKLAKEI